MERCALSRVSEIKYALAALRAQELQGVRELTEATKNFNRALENMERLMDAMPVVRRPWWPRGWMLPAVMRVRWYWWFRRRRVREWRAMCAQVSDYPGQFQLGFCL